MWPMGCRLDTLALELNLDCGPHPHTLTTQKNLKISKLPPQPWIPRASARMVKSFKQEVVLGPSLCTSSTENKYPKEKPKRGHILRKYAIWMPLILILIYYLGKLLCASLPQASKHSNLINIFISSPGLSLGEE